MSRKTFIFETMGNTIYSCGIGVRQGILSFSSSFGVSVTEYTIFCSLRDKELIDTDIFRKFISRKINSLFIILIMTAVETVK